MTRDTDTVRLTKVPSVSQSVFVRTEDRHAHGHAVTGIARSDWSLTRSFVNATATTNNSSETDDKRWREKNGVNRRPPDATTERTRVLRRRSLLCSKRSAGETSPFYVFFYAIWSSTRRHSSHLPPGTGRVPSTPLTLCNNVFPSSL